MGEDGGQSAIFPPESTVLPTRYDEVQVLTEAVRNVAVKGVNCKCRHL